MIKFLPLGGAGEIGANCFYINLEGCGIILDCGMHPQKTGVNALPDFNLIENLPVDYVLISHAHQDHLSALPFLVQKFPYIKIISTPQTRALAELTLHNSISILKEQVNENDGLKIYSHEEIDLLIQSIDYRAYEEKFYLRGYHHREEDVSEVTFHDAGHIIGSASILIKKNGIKIFYTGDINLQDQMILKRALLPAGKVDALILETTYGSTDSNFIPGWKDEAMNFAQHANKILSGGGSILIPVFSLGKMQEILAAIWKLMETGTLSKTDIYTGGIASKISRVYDYNRYVINQIDPEIELKSIVQKDLYGVENPDDFFKHPCIALAPSGMMIKNTASYLLARRWIKQNKSAIFTVGFMEESTPGYLIANSKKGDKINFGGDGEEVKCTIKQFRFPSHSKREDLLEIVKRLKPEKVILVHGDADAIDWIGAEILKFYRGIKLYAAEKGKEIQL
jgi:Cft2 family RNA processing exonuclease